MNSNTVWHNGKAYPVKRAAIAASTSGDNTLVAAVTGFRIAVVFLELIAASDVTIRFESGAGGTALSGQQEIPAKGGKVLPFNPGVWYLTAASALLNLELSSAVSVAGSLGYIEVE